VSIKVTLNRALLLVVLGLAGCGGDAQDVTSPLSAKVQANAMSAIPAGTQPGPIYVLVNPNSGMALDVLGTATTNGTAVGIDTQNSSVAQQWQVDRNSDGTYTLINPAGGLALDVQGAGTANNTPVDIYSPNGTAAQEWQIIANSDATYTLVNPASGLALDVAGAKTASGTPVHLYTDNGNPAQRWKFIPASQLYVNPQSNAATWVKANGSDGRAAAINTRIAQVPTAYWLTGGNVNVSTAVGNYVNAAAALNQVPILVAYNIPDRDCGGASAGGASSSAAYQTWVQAFAEAIGTSQAVVILEPDALADSWPAVNCFANQTQQTQATRLSLLSYAITQFNTYAPNALVYLDIGNSSWVPAAQAAQLLISAGVADVHGFSLNVSNFQTDSQSIAYGNAINTALQQQQGFTKPFSIDTSRNGNGPLLNNGSTVWCDPTTRKIGALPTLYPPGSQPELRLWVKLPGNTDGCATPSGSTVPYPAGTFAPQIAYDLIFGY
jgi:endoglucanase